jgi:hypothetical protein
MSEIHQDEAWQLYRQVLKERDVARSELDTLRLMTLEAIRERDEARALGRECYEILRRIVRADERFSRERWEELDRLRDRVRPHGWLHEPPSLNGAVQNEERCPTCGLPLNAGRRCLLCGPASGRDE